jgi:transcriptional regulator with XRE-family HTH domain
MTRELPGGLQLVRGATFARFRLTQALTCERIRRMVIGKRLRQLREERNLSQGSIEKRTGLLRCYISRVENGHTVPSLETLERLAAALQIPLYQLFYEGDAPPPLPNLSERCSTEELAQHSEQEDGLKFIEKVKQLLSGINERDRQLLLYVAQKLANR